MSNGSPFQFNAIKQARDDATAVQSETARVVLEEREKAMREGQWATYLDCR